MNRLVLTLCIGFLVTSPLAAQDRERHYTIPRVPPREVLDRLNLTVAWQAAVPTDGRRDGLAFVQVGTKDLFVQTHSGIIAMLDAETGRTRWQARVGKPYMPVMPLTYNLRGVYVVSGNELYALDRQTGVRQWVFDIPGGVTAPPICDILNIYLSTADTRLTAYFLPQTGLPAPEPTFSPGERLIDIAGLYSDNPKTTGSIGMGLKTIREAGRKEVAGHQPKRVWDETTTYRLAFRPVQTKSRIVLPTPAGKVLLYNKFPDPGSDTVRLFTYTMSSGASVGPGQFGEQAYIGSEDGTLYAVDIPSVRLLWRHVTGDPIARRPVALEEDVYITSKDGGLARLDRATAEPQWRVRHGGVVEDSNPAADRFLAANAKFVYALDHSGRLLVLSRRLGTTLSWYNVRDWSFPVPNEVTDRLYLAANNGSILCLRDKEYRTPLRHRTEEEEISNPLNKVLAQKITRPLGRPTALQEVLDELTNDYKLNFFISEKAFEEAGRPSPKGQSIIFPPANEDPLGEILQRILAQVNAGYQVVEDTILIYPTSREAGGSTPEPEGGK